MHVAHDGDDALGAEFDRGGVKAVGLAALEKNGRFPLIKAGCSEGSLTQIGAECHGGTEDARQFQRLFISGGDSDLREICAVHRSGMKVYHEVTAWHEFA